MEQAFIEFYTKKYIETGDAAYLNQLPTEELREVAQAGRKPSKTQSFLTE